MPRDARRAAEAVAGHVRKQLRFHEKRVEQAIVQSTDPLTAELVEGALVLDETQLLLGFSARKYDQDHGIEVGDTLTISEVSGDDYVVLEVHGTKEILKGAGTDAVAGTTKTLSGTGPNPGAGTVTVTIPLPVAHWLPAYDESGARIGWIPVFATQT